MRDLAVLRCEGLSAKELILLRMVAAAPCAMDMTEKYQASIGKKILGSLLDLAESFLREFYQTTVVPHVTSIEDYETAASACAQQAFAPLAFCLALRLNAYYLAPQTNGWLEASTRSSSMSPLRSVFGSPSTLWTPNSLSSQAQTASSCKRSSCTRPTCRFSTFARRASLPFLGHANGTCLSHQGERLR